jgi:nitrate reductase alpha subunit
MGQLSRRDFLKYITIGTTTVSLFDFEEALGFQFLEPVKVDNPLAHYPSRDWEVVYRDIWRHDGRATDK